jgi:hypothetical protein
MRRHEGEARVSWKTNPNTKGPFENDALMKSYCGAFPKMMLVKNLFLIPYHYDKLRWKFPAMGKAEKKLKPAVLLAEESS